MDVLPRITRQLFELFQAMSPIQRATFVAVPLLILAGLTSIVVFNRPDDHQAVLFGRTFTSEELITAEKALNHAGLLNYRRSDRKLLVPAADLDRYNAALVEFDAVPPDLGSQILKQFESLGPFSTDRHRQEMKDALLLQELRRMIKSVPDIEDARVAVANSGRRVGFGQKPRVTANVTVKPRAGRELSARLVGSLRQAVASMVPDLQAVDVTVFDVARGQAFTGDPNEESLDGRLIQRVREFTRQYEQQIHKAISFIPQSTVAVHVDLDNLKSSVIRHERVRISNDDMTIANRPGSVQQVAHSDDQDAIQHSAAFRGSTPPTDYTREVSERELLAAMPRAVQVSVSIPRDYYRHVAKRRQGQGETNKRRLDLDSIEEEVLTKVERTVARLIPVGSPHDAISVTTIDQLPMESTETTLSSTDQLTVLAWKHGGSWGLGLFAVIALWMVSRLAFAPSSASAKTEKTTPHRYSVATSSSETPDVAPPAVPLSVVPSVPATTRVPVAQTAEPKAESLPASLPTAATTVAAATTVMRDEILALAQSDPATTAAVLSQWLAEAR